MGRVGAKPSVVVYEELVEQRESTLRAVLEHLGVEPVGIAGLTAGPTVLRQPPGTILPKYCGRVLARR